MRCRNFRMPTRGGGCAYHLVQAGRKDDLRRLLLDFNYLQAKLAATDPNALIADYDYLAEEEDLRTDTIRHPAFGACSGSRALGNWRGNCMAGSLEI